MVSNGQALASPRDVFFRDTSSFVPGELYNHYQEWEKIAPNGEADEVLSFIRDGVDVSTYFNPYKGTFAGQDYDSPYPPPREFPHTVVHPVRNSRILLTLLSTKECVQDLYYFGVSLGKFSHRIW